MIDKDSIEVVNLIKSMISDVVDRLLELEEQGRHDVPAIQVCVASELLDLAFRFLLENKNVAGVTAIFFNILVKLILDFQEVGEDPSALITQLEAQFDLFKKEGDKYKSDLVDKINVNKINLN